MKLKKKLMSLALVMAMAVCMLPMSGMAKVDAATHDYGTYSAGDWVVDGDTETRTSVWTLPNTDGTGTAFDANTQMSAGDTIAGGIICNTTKVKFGKDYFTICSGGVAGIPVAENVTSGTLTLHFTSNKSSGERSLLNASGEVAFTYMAKGDEAYSFTTADIVDGYITLESAGSAPGDIKMDSITLVETRPVSAGVEDTDTTTQENMYVQYKEQGDGKYTLRFVVPVALDTIDTLDGVGVSMTANGYTELVAGKDLFSSLWADGEVVYAPSGYAFAIIELTNVPSGTQFTEVKPAYVPETGETTYGSSFTYTVQ